MIVIVTGFEIYGYRNRLLTEAPGYTSEPFQKFALLSRMFDPLEFSRPRRDFRIS